MPNSSKVLSYLNLSDAYERKSRFVPATLAICTFGPAAMALSLPLMGWLGALVTGAGVASVVCVGVSHLASAMGNRFQLKLFPDWPHDSPTNLRLSPLDSTCSNAQKQQWYDKIKSVTGLSVQEAPASDRHELDRLVNDGVTAIRTALWKHPKADRLHTQNSEYGFARNFAGLAPVWLALSASSTLICWVTFALSRSDLGWAIASTLITLGLTLLHRFVLPDYVATKAEHYADSFFDALNLLDPKESARVSNDAVASPNQELSRTE